MSSSKSIRVVAVIRLKIGSYCKELSESVDETEERSSVDGTSPMLQSTLTMLSLKISGKS